MTDVTLVDMECGNIASVEFALARLGVAYERTQDPVEILGAKRVILPGVGTANFAMAQLHRLELVSWLRDVRQPMLGICLGMQLLFTNSEEGNTDCLGVINGTVKRMLATSSLPVPHMGWSQLQVKERQSPLLTGIAPGAFAYFVHSYACPVNASCVAAVEYGEEYAAIVQSGNVFGCQFHPERSAEAGAQVLKNFMSVPC